LITKGYDFGSLFAGSGGSSRIRVLVSGWKVERGIAQAKDVAMATTRTGSRSWGASISSTNGSTMSPWRWSTGRDAPRCARRSTALSGNRRWRR